MAYFPGTQSFRQGFPRTRTKQGGNNRRAMTANGLPNLMARGLPVPGKGAGNRETPPRGWSQGKAAWKQDGGKPPGQEYQDQIRTLFRGSSDRPGKGGYQTLSDTFKAMNKDMSLEQYRMMTDPTRRQAMTGGLGSDIANTWLSNFQAGGQRQARRQALRQAGRTPNLSDAGFGSGASLAGVTDFDRWAEVMRNPQYQAGQAAFLAGPGQEEQLARDESQGIREQILGRVGLTPGAGGNYTGQPVSTGGESRGYDGLMQYATPSTLFDSSGNLIAPPPSSVPTSTFTPPTSPINLGGFGSGAMTPQTAAPQTAAPAPTFSFTPNTKALQKLDPGEERQAARQEQRQTARQDFRQAAPAPAAPAPTAPGNGAGAPAGGTANPMADEYQQALARMGLPLDPMYEMLSNQARSNRDISLMNVENTYNTEYANAGLRNTLAHQAIDENAAARGLFGSGIERRNERYQNTDYTQGLLGLLQQKQLGTQGAYTGYANAMQQAVLDLANRQMQDPYSAVPNYYDWMTGESTIAGEQGAGGGGADRLARLRELLRTGDLNQRQRERIRTRVQGLRG